MPRNESAASRFGKRSLPLVTVVLALAGAASARTDPDGTTEQRAPGVEPERLATGAALLGRADLWRSLRLEKKHRIPQPQPEPEDGSEEGSEEGWLDRVSKALSPLKSIRPVLGGSHEGSTFELGAEWKALGIGRDGLRPRMANRADLTLRAESSLTGYASFEGRFAVRRLAGSAFHAELTGAYWRDPAERFYGLGIDSREEDRTLYTLRRASLGTRLWYEPINGLRTGGGVDHVDLRPSPGGSNDSPSIETRFEPAAVPGLAEGRSFLRAEAFVELDTRDLPSYPRSGGYYRARLHDYFDRSRGENGFRSYRLELEQYVPFLHHHRVLAFRVLGDLTDAASEQRVPFYLQPALGGAYDLRGVPTYRYRDRNKLLMQAEYRWEAWIGLDMALFFDAGQVFADREAFSRDRFETGYGLGFRFHGEESMLLRVDVARAQSDWRTVASFTHGF